MKTKFNLILILSLFVSCCNYAQQKSPFILQNKGAQNDISMTWNKNTPESEMKSDIKALGEKGITITYSNVKRNSKGEITAIKMEYSDRKGNKGAMELNNQKPINTLKFFRQGEEIGFGEPSNSDFLAGNQLDFSNPENLLQQYNFNFDKDSLSTDQFRFQFPGDSASGQTKSKIIIKERGKQPLVIENGKVIEGAEGYTPEEIEKIEKENSFNNQMDSDAPFSHSLQGGNFNDINEQLKKMQQQLDGLIQQSDKADKSDPQNPKKSSNEKGEKENKKEPTKDKPIKMQKV